MTEIVLTARVGLAVMLIVSGSAKLSDLRSFAATVRLFLAYRVGVTGTWRLALCVAGVEVAVGAASLCAAAPLPINVAVAVLAYGFVIAASYGYARHRGRSCRCFGALSNHGFDAAGIARSAAILATALLALDGVPASSIDLGGGQRGLLAAGALLLAVVSFTASRALVVVRSSNLGGTDQ